MNNSNRHHLVALIKLATTAALCLSLTSIHSLAGEVLVYFDPNGNKVFTDKHLKDKRYVPVNHSHIFQWKPSALTKARKSRYDADILYAGRSYNVKPALIKAVIHAESHFDPTALSTAGAKGLMQLMPATGAMYQLKDFHNPRQNILAGTQYLRYLLDKFDNNWLLAIAAYNAGEGHVRRYGGVPPFNETQRYVKKVRKLYNQYRGHI